MSRPLGNRPGNATRSSRRGRLRRRVFRSLAMTGGVLGPLLVTSIWGAASLMEDSFLKRQATLEAARLETAHAAGHDIAPAPRFTVFWNLDAVPEPYRSWHGEIFPTVGRPLEQLEPGIYEATGTEGFILVSEPPESGATLYLFYDVHDLEPLEGLELPFYGGFTVIFALAVLALALALARWLDREVLAPLRELADASERWDLDDWRTRPLSSDDRGDEIGQLARASRAAAQRIHDFLARERQFTRNASHELRSPLTVIRGASELLRARAPDAQSPALDRIERAVRRMESTIETFLWLAREEAEPPGLPVEVDAAVRDCLDALPRRPDRDQPIHLEIPPNLTLSVPAPALRIVLDNLIGNALRHGGDGPITISAAPHHLAVTNPLPASAAPPDPRDLHHPFVGRDTGVGLALVSDLCHRYGWSLHVDPDDETFYAEVRFDKPMTDDA